MKFIATFKTVLCGLFILSVTTFTFAADHISDNTKDIIQSAKIMGGGTTITVMGRSTIRVTNGSKIPFGTLNAAYNLNMTVLIQKDGVSICQHISQSRVLFIDCTGFPNGEYTITVTTQSGMDVHEITLE